MADLHHQILKNEKYTCFLFLTINFILFLLSYFNIQTTVKTASSSSKKVAGDNTFVDMEDIEVEVKISGV